MAQSLQIFMLVACLALIAPSCNGWDMPKFENHVVERILQNYTNSSTLRICDIFIEKAANPGDSYFSEYYRIIADGFKNGESCGPAEDWSYDYTKHLIVKVPHEDELDSHLFELFVYQQALPELEKYLPPNTNLEFPKMVYAAPRMIFLEDWAQSGYSKVDRRRPYVLETMEASLKELAKLHSASIIMKQNAPSYFNHIAANLRDHLMNSLKSQKVFDIFNASFEMAKLKMQETYFKNYISKKEVTSIEGVFQLSPKEIFNSATATIKAVPEELEVIIHGDFWQNNVMVMKSDPSSIKVIDLADLCRSNLVRDLIYIFATSPMKMEERKPAVEKYLHNLKFFLKQGNVEDATIEKYTTELLMKEIKRLRYFEFFIGTIFAMPTQFISVPSEEMIEKMSPEQTRTFLSGYLGNGYNLKVRYTISNFLDNEK